MSDKNRKYRLKPVWIGNGPIGERSRSEPSAVLQIDDVNGGFLTSRLSQVQRDAIANPADGLMIWNTDTNQMEIFANTTWGSVGGAGGGAVNAVFGRSGNVIPAAGDYDAIQIDVAPSGNLSSTTVQAALLELQGDINTLNAATHVNSFAGRTGVVVAAASDYDAIQVDVTPVGNLSSINVQAALQELQLDIDAIPNEVIENPGALSGAAPAGAQIGVDTTTGAVYYVSGGNWAAVPTATVDLNTTVAIVPGTYLNLGPASAPAIADTGDLHIEIYDSATAYFTAIAPNTFPAPAQSVVPRDITAFAAATTASNDAVGTGGVAATAARSDHKHAAQGVSTDLNNALSVGADGLHFYNGKARAFAADTSVAPAVAGSPTLVEIQAFVTTGTITDTLVYYTGTNLGTDPVTHVYAVDQSGSVTLLRSPGGTVPGIDDVLGVGQTLTANRTIQTDTNNLTITAGIGAVNSVTSFRPTFVRTIVSDATGGQIFHGINPTFMQTNIIDGASTADMFLSSTGLELSSSTGIGLTVSNSNQLIFRDSGGRGLGFRAPAVVTTPALWDLPGADGTAGQALTTNGAGILSWASAVDTWTRLTSGASLNPGNYTLNSTAAGFSLTLNEVIGEWEFGDVGFGLDTNAVVVGSALQTFTNNAGVQVAGPITLNENGMHFKLVNTNGSNEFLLIKQPIPTGAAPFVNSFNATTDWGTASGGYYTITILAATHGIASPKIVQVWEDTAGDFDMVTVDRTRIAANGDVSIRVIETPDGRIAGRIIIQ